MISNFQILLSTSISSILHHLKTPHTPYLDNFSQLLLEVTICVRIVRMFDKMRHAASPAPAAAPSCAARRSNKEDTAATRPGNEHS